MQWLLDGARVILGLYFIFSGLNHFLGYKAMTQYTSYKKVPAPGLAVVVTGLMLLFGGITILLGMYVQWGLAVLALFLVSAALLMHNFWTVEDPMARTNEMSNHLKNWALASALILLLSVDAWNW
ncbi:MAG: DoxX family protein [Bacillota bacterium]|nr:DoxX family protein [Bacillota bacterium]